MVVVEISDLGNSTFRTSQSADTVCANLTNKLGWKHRYVAARLALGRSLSVSDFPAELSDEESDDMATAMRGRQLFGDDSQAVAWLALITEHSSQSQMTKKDLQELVARHWHRGAMLLQRDWKEAGQQMQRFVARLTELADFSTSEDGLVPIPDPSVPTYSGEVELPVGEIARDLKSEEQVLFSINGAGGSPHMAIMGGVGSGKTRTAICMLQSLRQNCNLPLLAFDFKGDLTDSFVENFGATPLSPPEDAIPLDVLHVSSTDDFSIKTAAARIRDSIAAVKPRKLSGVQSDSLRVAVESVLRKRSKENPVRLDDVTNALESEYSDLGRKPDELTATLRELTQFRLFESDSSLSDFFANSWVIQIPQDGSLELRRLIINLALDALDRWINAQPDAPADEQGTRALRHLTMLDEAHVILSSRLPALANLVRMSRSKGGVIMMLSQSPDDFKGADDSYLDNMGLTLAFNTQASPGPTRRIFGVSDSLSNLQVGEALCKIRSKARTQKILCWST